MREGGEGEAEEGEGGVNEVGMDTDGGGLFNVKLMHITGAIFIVLLQSHNSPTQRAHSNSIRSSPKVDLLPYISTFISSPLHPTPRPPLLTKIPFLLHNAQN